MIYTSRYQNPELSIGQYTVVGVTRGHPRFQLKYVLAGNIMEIAPPGYLFKENDRARFTPEYFRHMDNQGVLRIKNILQHYEQFEKDIVLCCFEDVRKESEWCHRLVFAEWWEKRTGVKIPELQDTSPPPKEKKESEQHPVQPQAEQLKMW